MNSLFQIIVPVFNEEQTLEKILLHAKKNNYLKHILFVDDASTDSSLEILSKWAKIEGIRAIRLANNCKKEGAIRIALEMLAREGSLAPFTVLLDSDAFIVPSETGEGIDSQIGNAIAHMKANGLSGLALQIDAISDIRENIFSYGAFADYAGMQFDQWFVSKHQKVWVINGPGGIFETNRLLSILRSIVPDFETGDLLITVELMKQNLPIEFYPDIPISTFVPTKLKDYFNQRRRWERGTTKVLWTERRFYLGLFGSFSLLALSTLIHLSLYIGLLTSLIMILTNAATINDFLRVLLIVVMAWFVISILKGLWLMIRRSNFPFVRYCFCSLGNGMLWALITTPARITGFLEGVIQLIFASSKETVSSNIDIVEFLWLPIEKR